MDNSEQKRESSKSGSSVRHNIRLPGFITEEEIGLGDLVKKATYAVGIKPCGGCEQRATALNRWMKFGPKR
jgi:hypothetical protein